MTGRSRPRLGTGPVLGPQGLGAPGRESLRQALDVVLAAQERLHTLLDAVVGIGAHLDLRAVLHRVVAAACKLSGAHYGPLGMLSPDGETLSDFITFGIDDPTRQQIGELPQGHGILGLLIRGPRPSGCHASVTTPSPTGSLPVIRR